MTTYARHVWSDGAGLAISAARLNEVEVGIEQAHSAVPTALVYPSATQSIPSDATNWTTLGFDTELFDNDTMHSPTVNNSRLVATTQGVYCIVARVEWAASSAGWRQTRILLNGVTVYGQADALPISATVTHNMPPCVVIRSIAAASYVEVQVRQNSGAALLVQAGLPSTTFGMALQRYT